MTAIIRFAPNALDLDTEPLLEQLPTKTYYTKTEKTVLFRLLTRNQRKVWSETEKGATTLSTSVGAHTLPINISSDQQTSSTSNTMARPFFPTNTSEPLSSSRDEGDGVGGGNLDLYIIFCGVALAVVLFFVALYWILRSDRLQRQRRRLLWEVQQRMSRNSNEGSVLSRQAGLQGLSVDERQKILEEWLRRTAFEYSDDDEENGADIEKGDGGDTADADQDDDQSLQENICSICFDDYVAGDSVMTGTQCRHLFHSDCAREWLLSKSNHDNCPYCRVEFLRPCEFLDEARTVLGEARVAELLGEDKGIKDETDSDTDDEEAGSSTTASSVQMELGPDR